MLQRLDLALAHQRAEGEGQASGRHHLVYSRRQRQRQAHAAVIRIGGNADPATLRNRPEPVRVTGGGAHDAVLQFRRGQVAVALQRRQRLLRHLARFAEDRCAHVGGRFGEFRRLRQPVGADEMGEGEFYVAERRSVSHGLHPALLSSTLYWPLHIWGQ